MDNTWTKNKRRMKFVYLSPNLQLVQELVVESTVSFVSDFCKCLTNTCDHTCLTDTTDYVCRTWKVRSAALAPGQWMDLRNPASDRWVAAPLTVPWGGTRPKQCHRPYQHYRNGIAAQQFFTGFFVQFLLQIWVWKLQKHDWVLSLYTLLSVWVAS